MAQSDQAFRALEERLGVRFEDPDLLQRACVHRSYLNENPDSDLVSNERLEFLGDAVLGHVVALWLFHEMPEAAEGDLTRARAALVRRETLGQVAQDLGLGACLLLGKGEDAGGGRYRPPNLANAFEAVIGALYLDQGEAAIHGVVERLLGPRLAHYQSEASLQDEKSRLQEIAQARLRHTPMYRLVEAHGPDHERRFIVEVMVGDQSMGRGAGRSKRDAERAAAREALERLTQTT